MYLQLHHTLMKYYILSTVHREVTKLNIPIFLFTVIVPKVRKLRRYMIVCKKTNYLYNHIKMRLQELYLCKSITTFFTHFYVHDLLF